MLKVNQKNTTLNQKVLFSKGANNECYTPKYGINPIIFESFDFGKVA